MYLITRGYIYNIYYDNDRMHKYCGSNVDCSLGSVVFKYCRYRNIRVRSQSCGKSCVSVRFLFRAVPLVSVGLLRRTIILHVIIYLHKTGVMSPWSCVRAPEGFPVKCPETVLRTSRCRPTVQTLQCVAFLLPSPPLLRRRR